MQAPTAAVKQLQKRTLSARLIHFRGALAGGAQRLFGFRYRPIVRFIFWLRREPLRAALYGIDEQLVGIIGKENGYFIELGANNGISQSNSLLLETNHGWKGILIEPFDSVFRELSHNRNSRRNCLVRAACVSDHYRSPNVTMTYLNLMSVAHGLENDLPDREIHLSEGQKFLKGSDRRRRELVPARTLTSVLEECNAPEIIDLLSLDVEGSELEVLKGIDFERWEIRWILVECRNISKMSMYLRGFGYLPHSSLTSNDVLFELAI